MFSLETAKGVVHSFEIASCSPRIAGLCFGADDFRADLQLERSALGLEDPILLQARISMSISARAAGVPAFDTPWIDVKNLDGLEKFIPRSKAAGFNGMCSIHPSHVELINNLFSPSSEQVENSKNLLLAFIESCQKDGRASLLWKGQMVDIPVLHQNIKLLEKVDDPFITDLCKKAKQFV